MAGASLLALIDDIATVLDDVALLTKVAAKKTAGVLGDDLALNAQQVSGLRAPAPLIIPPGEVIGDPQSRRMIPMRTARSTAWVRSRESSFS